MAERPMLPIPIAAARRIAIDFGYDQVIVIARRAGAEPDPFGEHVTTYGVNKTHCGVAARVGSFLKHKVMGWPEHTSPPAGKAVESELTRLRVRVRIQQRAIDRWVPCPDHRDKTEPGRCYVCENETLKRQAVAKTEETSE